MVVQHHRVCLLASRNLVKKYQRNAPAPHLVEVVKLLGVARQRHQYARHLGVEQRLYVAPPELHILV